MAEWHLHELDCALTRAGWRVDVLPTDDPLPDGLWRLRRGSAEHLLEFECFDARGHYLPAVEQSYGCYVRGARRLGLYFPRRRSRDRWRIDLAAFITALRWL